MTACFMTEKEMQAIELYFFGFAHRLTCDNSQRRHGQQ
jgi:hypothetical protein